MKQKHFALCAATLLTLTLLLSSCARSVPTGAGNDGGGIRLTIDEAKEIALEHAQVAAADAKWDDRDFDLDDGRQVYELEFKAGGMEYSYEIDALSGEILKSGKERID